MHDDPTLPDPVDPRPGGVRRSADLGKGDVIDRYRLIEVLGEGGFGIVWRAEQLQPVRREVALKVIKPGMDSGAVLARFKAERQALAIMDHPCIATVLDGGVTDRGLPYFVMELVRGEPITQFCDGLRLPVGDRLRLFIDVCDAVQHAHMKGVIHRDLKPSNILVGYDAEGKPRPKVIDFGIAKALNQQLTEATIFTERGQMIGTPSYMSPEQAVSNGVDIDTRSDVYSLGVVLYELLVGVLPFDAASLRTAGYAEIQRIIREVDPPRPSTRLSGAPVDDDTRSSVVHARGSDYRQLHTCLKRDLDWLVMRCLEKDRTRRYDTAGDVADEIRRYLNNEPIEAGPPSAVYRARKFARRNRAGVLAGSLVLSAVVLAVIGTTWGMLWAFEERDRAEEAERVAADRADELELVSAFQSAQLSGIDTAGMGRAIREGVIRQLQESMRLQGAEPEAIEAAGADLGGRLARVNFTTLSLNALQTHVFDRAFAAINTEFAARPLIRASLLQTLASTLRSLGLWESALTAQRLSMEIRRAELGDRHPDTLFAIGRTASLLGMLGRLDETEPLVMEELEGMRAILGPDHRDTLGALNNLGALYVYQNRSAEAIPVLEDVLERQTRVLGEDDVQTIRTLGNLSFAHEKLGRMDLAEDYQRESFTRFARSLGPDDLNTISSAGDLINKLIMRGKVAEAEELLRDALPRSRAALGNKHQTTVNMLMHAGRVRLAAGDHAGAEPYLREAWEAQAEFEGEHAVKTLRFLARLADALIEQGKLDEAEPMSQEVQRHLRTPASAERLARIYDRRHALRPDAGFDAEAAHWRDRASGTRPSTGGTP